MEYVEGERIETGATTKTAGAGRLSYSGLCAAVQYAHEQAGNPSRYQARQYSGNADGTPKLLDFGIAKVLNPEVATRSWKRPMGRGR